MTYVVVGGGTSGLIAAIELARQGHAVTVLEGSPAPGGRAQSHVAEGFTLNLGPHALYPGAAARLAELGVHVAGRTPKRGLTMRRGERLAPLPSDPLTLLGNGGLGWGDKLRVGALLGRVGWMEPEALDGVTVAGWLDGLGVTGAGRGLLEAVVRVATYVNAPDRLSAGVALRQVQGALGGVLYLDGGWQTIVDGLAARATELGVAVRTRAKVEALEIAEGRAVAVRVAGGEQIACEGVVLTLSPKACAKLLGAEGRPSLAAFAAGATAVRAACLDVALSRLPRRHPSLILGTDAPTYLSVHSNTAALAPEGGGLIHVARYLAPDERVTPETRASLERELDLSQPGWREALVEARWSPAMTVTHAIPEAATGGLVGRPRASDAGPANVALAGDWVGPEGMLFDACVASARAAGAYLAGLASRAAA